MDGITEHDSSDIGSSSWSIYFVLKCSLCIYKQYNKDNA